MDHNRLLIHYHGTHPENNHVSKKYSTAFPSTHLGISSQSTKIGRT